MQIENSVTRVTVWHHKTCQVMPNSYPEWWNFQFAPNNQYRFFFLHTLPLTTAFKLKCVLFCQFYAKISTFLVKTCSVQPLHSTLTSEHLAENDVKNWCDVKMKSWHFLAPVRCTEILVGYARNIALCLKLPLVSYVCIVWVNIKGFGVTAQLRKLTWAFVVCLCDKSLFTYAGSNANLTHLSLVDSSIFANGMSLFVI